MGKKHQPGSGKSSGQQPVRGVKYWCYYCNAEAKDEATLIQHQASKHFQCQFCDKHAYGRQCLSLGGLISHVRRSHRKELDRVPGAIDGRHSLDVHVYGMSGIPEEVLASMKEDEPEEEFGLQQPAIPTLAGARPAGPSLTVPVVPKLPVPARPQLRPVNQGDPTTQDQGGGDANALESLSQVEALTSGKLDAIAKALVAAAATNTSVKAATVEGAATKALLAAAAASTTNPDAAGGAADVPMPAAREPVRSSVPDMPTVTPSLPASFATTLPASLPAARAPDAAEPPKPPTVTMQLGKAAVKPAFNFITTTPQKPSAHLVEESAGGICARMAENAKAFAASLKASGNIQPQEPGRKQPQKKDPVKELEQAQARTKYVLPQGVFLDQSKTKDREADSWMYLGRIPEGTTERALREECAKYGTVASVFYADSESVKQAEGPWALVSLTPPAKNQLAVQRLNRRIGIFNSTQPVEVRMATSLDIGRVRALLEQAEEPPPDQQPQQMETVDPELALQQFQGEQRGRDRNRDSRSRSDRRRRRSESRGGRRRRRQRSIDSREPDYARPNADDGAGALQLVMNRPPVAGGLGGMGVRPAAGALAPLSATGINVQEGQGEFSGGKQVACRTGWAHFVKPDGRYYYVNVLTGERRRTLPQNVLSGKK